MIVYFSGTGNSRYCAQMLAEELEDEVLDAAGYIKNGIAPELITGKPWVFVCPVYAWQMPRIFVDFIRGGSFAGSEDAYFVLTCGSDIGNAGEYIAPLCEEKGLNYRGTLPVVMPENYVAMFNVPDEAESEGIIAAARPVLKEAAGWIGAGEPFPERDVTVADRKKSGAINKGFYKRYVKAKAFYATESCVSCGECVERCLLNNVKLQEGKPVWGENCTHCMACICYCPTEAIEYGKKSKGKRRYRCPEYEKAN